MSRALIGRMGRYFSGMTVASALAACATFNDSSVHGDADGSAGAPASAGSAGSLAGAASAAGSGTSAGSAGSASTVSGAPGVSGGGSTGSGGRAGAPAGGAAGSGGTNNAGASGGGAGGNGGVMNNAGASGGGAAGNGGTAGNGGAAGSGGTAGSGGSGGNNTTATLLSQGKTATADSEQTGNLAPLGNDGVTTTRWCAADNGLNHHWQVDLGALKTLTKINLTWEQAANYKFLIEGSLNGTAYTTLSDQRTTTNASATQSYPLTGAPQARWVRVTVTGLPTSNVWASFFECAVYGY